MTIEVMGILVRCEIEGCPNGFHVTPSSVDVILGYSIDIRTIERTARAAGWLERNGHDFCSQECLDKYGNGAETYEDRTVRDASTFPAVPFSIQRA